MYATCGLLIHPVGPCAGPEPKLMSLAPRSLHSRLGSRPFSTRVRRQAQLRPSIGHRQQTRARQAVAQQLSLYTADGTDDTSHRRHGTLQACQRDGKDGARSGQAF